MLWVLFNNSGQCLGQANVGSLPFAGTDEFQIFAVFEDVNLDNYGSASIKLYKPDLSLSSDTALPMVKETIEFDGSANDYFTVGTSYTGFYFDFRDYSNEDGSELLDTAGDWRAVITLLNVRTSTLRNVIGSVTFNVGNGNESEESGDVSLDSILTAIYAQLGTKLNITSPDYIKTVESDDISSFPFEDAYNEGDIVLNRTDLKLYQLDENLEPVFVFDFGHQDVKRVDSLPVNTTGFEEGTLVFDVGTQKLYKVVSSAFSPLEGYIEIVGDTISEDDYDLALKHPEYPVIYDDEVYYFQQSNDYQIVFYRFDLNNTTDTSIIKKTFLIINQANRFVQMVSNSVEVYKKTKLDALLNGKVDKTDSGNKVYATDPLGEQTTLTYGKDHYDNDAIVQRQSNGQLSVPQEPVDNYDATSKDYVDSGLATKQDTLVSGINIKTINNLSLLGDGNIEIQGGQGGGAWGEITGDIQDQADLQAEFQNVREVAEGKSKTLVIRYGTTAPTSDLGATMFKKADGTVFTNLADFNSYVSGLTIANASFNTQGSVNLINYYLIGEDYIVYKDSYLKTIFRVGDIILVVETDVPDRWVLSIGSGYMFLGKLETTKVDLTNYATKTDLAAKSDLTNIAPLYDDSIGYNIGDLVIYEGKLYKCTTTISTAESWDSTHWTETDLDSDVVKLSGEQTITGEKTFEDGISVGGGTKIYNSTNRIAFYQGGDIRWLILGDGSLRPYANNVYDIGTNAQKVKDLYVSGNVNANNIKSSSTLQIDSSSYYTNFSGVALRPVSNNTPDLGTSGLRWKRLYIGNGIDLADGSSNILNHAKNTTYGLTLPDTTNFTANKEIAITDNVFNIIYASDMTDSTHFTQAQYEILTNGKPTLIKGTILNSNDVLVIKTENNNTANIQFIFFCNGGYGAYCRIILINSSTYQITDGQASLLMNSGGSYRSYLRGSLGGVIGTNDEKYEVGATSNSGVYIKINNVSKTLPTYPSLSSGDTQKVLTYKDDNTLAWENTSGFKVIPAPSSTTLTDDEYNEIVNGNGVQIIGNFLSVDNPILLKPNIYGTTTYYGLYLSSGRSCTFGVYSIVISSKSMYAVSSNDSFTQLRSIAQINGRNTNYYLNNTNHYASPTVSSNSVALDYTEVSNLSLTSDTTITLTALSGDYYPEYKANITNSGANAITLTFTGVAKGKTNDADITITEGTNTTVELPSGTTVEVNIQNGKMIVFNWAV